MVLVAPSEVALQSSPLLQLMRKRRLGVPSAQVEVEKVLAQLALSSSRHRRRTVAGSSLLSGVGPRSEGPPAPEDTGHP